MSEAGRVTAGTARTSARARLRARSKSLLGNQDRLEVGAAIARAHDPLVNAADLALELNMPNNRVRAQLIAFAAAGVLEALPATERIHWYERRPSPFWDFCHQQLEEWDQYE